mgnify:FL=1
MDRHHVGVKLEKTRSKQSPQLPSLNTPNRFGPGIRELLAPLPRGHFFVRAERVLKRREKCFTRCLKPDQGQLIVAVSKDGILLFELGLEVLHLSLIHI